MSNVTMTFMPRCVAELPCHMSNLRNISVALALSPNVAIKPKKVPMLRLNQKTALSPCQFKGSRAIALSVNECSQHRNGIFEHGSLCLFQKAILCLVDSLNVLSI